MSWQPRRGHEPDWADNLAYALVMGGCIVGAVLAVISILGLAGVFK